MIMKKIIILLSLVIVLTSCNTNKEPVIDTNIDNTWIQVETPITDTNKTETTDNWITSSSNQESTVEPVKDEPIKVEPKPVVKVETPKPEPVVVTPPKTTITKDEVAQHNKKSDCYTIIDWKVFDITSFFWKHPGWDSRIIGLCWVNWSSSFNSVHGSSEKAIMTKDKYFKANLGN